MLKLEQIAKWSIDKIGFDVLPIVYPKYTKVPVYRPNQFFGQQFIEQYQPTIKQYEEGQMIYHQYTKEKDRTQKYDMEYPYYQQNVFFRDISQQLIEVTHKSPKIAVVKGEGIAKSIRYELENDAEVDLIDTKIRNGEFLKYTNNLNRTNVSPHSVDGIPYLYNHKDVYDVVDSTSYHFEKQMLYVHPSLYAIKPGGIYIHTIQQQISFFKKTIAISPYRQRVQNMGINFGNDIAYHYIENCFSRVNEIAGMLDKHVEPILHATTFNIENDIQLVFRVRAGKKQLNQKFRCQDCFKEYFDKMPPCNFWKCTSEYLGDQFDQELFDFELIQKMIKSDKNLNSSVIREHYQQILRSKGMNQLPLGVVFENQDHLIDMILKYFAGYTVIKSPYNPYNAFMTNAPHDVIVSAMKSLNQDIGEWKLIHQLKDWTYKAELFKQNDIKLLNRGKTVIPKHYYVVREEQESLRHIQQ